MPKNEMKWALLDFSYMAHRARYSLQGLAHEDMPTGVLFGFFEQLMDICTHKLICSNRVAVFLDSKKSYRKNAFPDYKKKRHENRTEEEQKSIDIMHEQMRLLQKEIFPAIGLPTYRQTGLESDDLIAFASGEILRNGEEGIMVTSDGDLYQSINSNVLWFDPGRDKYWGVEDVLKNKGVGVESWAEVKAIGGCGSDGVPGVKGVSEKSAIQYLNGELPNRYKKFKSIEEAKANGELDLWRSLVQLPHAKTKPFLLREPEYDVKAFKAFCKEYGIMSYLEERMGKWEKFFKGEIRHPEVPRMRKGKRDGAKGKRMRI